MTRPIEIHDGAWIAAQVSVGPGAVIGQHAVVGFGSVVSGAVPPFEIHAGNPATFLRRREITAERTVASAIGRTTDTRDIVSPVRSIN